MDYLILNKTAALKYGINVSIILNDFAYWDNINKSNKSEHHNRDGKYWIYYSCKALAEHLGMIDPETGEFEYVVTPRQVQTALDKMIAEGLIVVAEKNYNRSKFDQTKWYSITEKGLSFFVTSIQQNVKSTFNKNDTPIQQNVKPIPNDNHKDNPNNNHFSTAPAHGNINATPVPDNRTRPDFKINIPDNVRQLAWDGWLQIITEHELEFTQKELAALKAFAYSRPKMQPYEVRATLTMIYGWAVDDALDVADALTRSLNTRTVVQAVMRKESDAKGQRIYDINQLNWIREQKIKQEKLEQTKNGAKNEME